MSLSASPLDIRNMRDCRPLGAAAFPTSFAGLRGGGGGAARDGDGGLLLLVLPVASPLSLDNLASVTCRSFCLRCILLGENRAPSAEAETAEAETAFPGIPLLLKLLLSPAHSFEPKFSSSAVDTLCRGPDVVALLRGGPASFVDVLEVAAVAESLEVVVLEEDLIGLAELSSALLQGLELKVSLASPELPVDGDGLTGVLLVNLQSALGAAGLGVGGRSAPPPPLLPPVVLSGASSSSPLRILLSSAFDTRYMQSKSPVDVDMFSAADLKS